MNRTLNAFAGAALVGLMAVPALGVTQEWSNERVAEALQRRPLPPSPTCTVHKKASRFRDGGYDHIVRITNSCARDAECTVYADSNPNPSSILVRAATTQAVVVARHARSSYFIPTVSCVTRT